MYSLLTHLELGKLEPNASPSSSNEAHASTHISVSTEEYPKDGCAYRGEYIPGILAFVTDSGSPSIHLSGFHSYESGPQMSGLVFDARIEGKTLVPFGTRTSCTSEPSLPRMGLENGRTASSRVLNENRR